MNRRCRLCKNPAVDESMFCDQHRSQAQLFAASFSATGPDERAEAEEADAEERPSRWVDPETGQGRIPKIRPRTSPPQSADSPEALLSERLEEAFEKLRERAQNPSPRDAQRWPQISFYCLHGKVHARVYYTIIPSIDEEAPQPSHPVFAVTDDVVSEALAVDGAVFAGLVNYFTEYHESLKNRWMRSLDLHFLTYAGLIAINEHQPTQEEHNLAAFKLEAGVFVAVEPAKVKERLRHERW